MSEADPPTASSPETSPILEVGGSKAKDQDGASQQTNTSTIDVADSLPSSSPPPPESTSPPPSSVSPPPASPVPPPPKESTSPPPEEPASPPPEANEPPPASPPPPDSPPPTPPTSSPPPSSASPPPSSPPPTTSPPPPLTPPSPPLFSPPGTHVFSPPPPKSIVSQSPPSPNNFPPSSSNNRSNQGSPFGPRPSSSDSTVHGLMIGGIVVGTVVIVVLCIVIACLLCFRKSKKPQGAQGPQYYMDPGRQPKVGEQQYYNDPTQWHSPRPIDQNIQLPPPPGFMGAPVGGVGGWGAPPMPPPANASNDISAGYSGQHAAPPSPNMGGITQFSYEELAAATSGFSQANLLGQGGFGYVHKGILPDRRVVACKSLKSGSGQGEREFQAEVEIISRVHHRHLVSLVGYCIANQQRMLVYEFVPNKTLEFHLHGKGQPVVEWATRLRISVGTAKGLAYLHEDCLPRIIHRDIKAANILLDNNYEAMVSDFGLAKLSSDNFTHVSTRVMGTFGYLAPEYASSGKLTEKSDVFSFGVMLLELITGRRPVDTSNRFMEDSLVDWARPLLSKALEDGNYDQLVDPRLESNYITHEMARMVACAAASIRHSARRRPKMSQIVRTLEGDSSLEDLNEGVKPGQSAVYNPNGGTDAYDTRAYNADMLKFKKMVMSSTEFNSSEYGATSEFGINPSSSSGDSPEMSSRASLDDVHKS